jgi:hypothetical protein
VRANLGAERTSKHATFQPTIAKRSPFGNEKGLFSPIRVLKQCSGRDVPIVESAACSGHRRLAPNTKGSEGSKPNLSATQSEPQRNQMLPHFDGKLSPVPSECKTCRIAAIFSDSCMFSGLFSKGYTYNPTSPIPSRECNAIISRSCGESALTFSQLFSHTPSVR